MADRPRPFSVTVVPLVLSIVALANLLLVVAMLLTDGLPDPILFFATDVFGRYPVPIAVLLVGGLLVVVASFAAWFAGLRRWDARPGSLGLSRTTTIAVPALIGLAMPSVWWQVGLPEAPARIDGVTSSTHITLAAAAILVPAALVLWRWWRARPCSAPR